MSFVEKLICCSEEFLILLPNTNADSATSLAEQIRACVERELVATDGAESRPVTVSIGVASVLPATTREDGIVEDPASELAQNVTGKDVIEATNNADLALYAAKEKRNTVESFELLLHDLPGDEPASN